MTAALNDRATGTKTADAFRDFFNLQASIGMIRRNRRARHVRHCRFFRVLNENRAAVLRNCPQPSGPVAVATTQTATGRWPKEPVATDQGSTRRE